MRKRNAESGKQKAKAGGRMQRCDQMVGHYLRNRDPAKASIGSWTEKRMFVRSISILPVIIWLASISFFVAPEAVAQSEDAAAAVRGILEDQTRAWNAGDIDAFMNGYWKSDSLRFASGGEVQRGWQATLERYHAAYPDRDAMGILTFTIYSVDVLSPKYAFVFGRYELDRTKDRPTGLFTLLLRRFDEGWRIVFDHTSVDSSGVGE